MHAEKVKLNYKLQSLFFIQAMHVPTEVNYLVMLNLLKLKKYYYPHQLGQCYYRITGYHIFKQLQLIQKTDMSYISHRIHSGRVQELRDSDN